MAEPAPQTSAWRSGQAAVAHLVEPHSRLTTPLNTSTRARTWDLRGFFERTASSMWPPQRERWLEVLGLWRLDSISGFWLA